MKKYLIALFIISSFTGCNTPEKTNTEAEEAKVRETFDQFTNAIESGDMEAYLSFLTDDFVGYDPGRAPITISDSFKNDMQAFFETTSFKLTKHKTQEVIVRGDIAVHRHTGTLLLGSKKDSVKSMAMNVNYLDVMQKNASGDWKFKIHTVNMSQ